MPRSAAAPALMRLPVLATAALAVGLALPAVGSAAATRTWVSGVGDDVNPCSRTAPCKTFAGAISKTEAGGEIDALDSGGFGTLSITKSITINGTGVNAGVLHTSTTGMVINAPATAEITLRGLAFHGGGEVGPTRTCGGSMGPIGVRVLSAGSVRIENTTFSNAVQAGVAVLPSAAAPSVLLDGVTVRNSCGAGVNVAPTGTGSADVTVRNSTISNTAVGLRVSSAGRAWISGSTIFDNALGLQTLGTGSIASYVGTNQVHGNGDDGAATSVIGAPVPGPAGAAGPAGPVGPVGAAGPVGPASAASPTDVKPTNDEPAEKCNVPKLTGLTRAAAEKRLAKGNCRVGKVTRKATAKVKVGRVLTQSRKAGSSAASGAKVNLTVGRSR